MILLGRFEVKFLCYFNIILYVFTKIRIIRKREFWNLLAPRGFGEKLQKDYCRSYKFPPAIWVHDRKSDPVVPP